MTMSRARLAGCLVGGALAFNLLMLQARAVVVSIGGNLYDVLVTNRSYEGDPSLFAPAAMPWFTDDVNSNDLAFDFAQAVDDDLGFFYYPGFVDPGGPLFAYANDSTHVFAVFQDLTSPAVQYDITIPRVDAQNYTYASLVPSPLPVVLPVMGFQWCRRLRSRIRGREQAS